jgi:hypothetical protein
MSSPPVSVDSVSDVASSSPPVSVDPLAYIIAVTGKNNEDIVKSNSKLIIWFIIPLLVAIYINIIPTSESAYIYAKLNRMYNTS